MLGVKSTHENHFIIQNIYYIVPDNNRFFMSNIPSTNRLVFLILLLLVLGTISFSFYLSYSLPKIAFVRTDELIYNYNGMRDARETYKTQTDVWQSNIDTLRVQYQGAVAEYQNSYKSLSEKDRTEKQALIKKLEENLKNYTTVIREQAQKKEQTMTESVLNQLNSYVEEFAKKKGYDFVISGTGGNLLYGAKTYDITDEVLHAINQEYRILPSQPASPPQQQ